jgi:CMP-N-acetylneuraminic acid synthetase
MKVTALVPMKGHSERVPNKNIKILGDKPLFYHIMETLSQISLIDKIVINTDSEKIAKMAKKQFNKVLIHDRPDSIQGDFVSMNTIIEYDIDKSGDEYFLQTHSTNPLLKEESIKRSIETFEEKRKEGYDSLFSVTKMQTRLYWKDGKAINHNPDQLIRTQDLPPVFEENSCIYLFSKNSFYKRKARIGEKPYMFETSPYESVDIDNMIDFVLAEQLYKIKETFK